MKDSNYLRQHRGKFCFIDLETYNLCLSFEVNRPWQTSMFITQRNDTIEKIDRLTKWNVGLEMGKEAAIITRYDKYNSRWEMSMREALEKHGEDESETFKCIDEKLNECDYIVAHNGIGFDFQLLKEWYRIHNKSFDKFIPKLIDTNCIARAVLSETKFHEEREDLFAFQMKIYHKRMRGIKSSLGVLGKNFEIEHDYDTLHDAYSDLDLNVKVWNKLKWMINV